MIIYKVTHTTTGKVYIGQTVRTLAKRKAEHLNAANNYSETKRPMLIHAVIRIHGSGEFTWEVIETCSSLAELNEREKHHIAKQNSLVPFGYNQTTGGYMDGSMAVDVRAKIAASMVRNHEDPEYRANLYAKLKGRTPPNKGKPMNEAQKAKVSAAKKAFYADPSYVNPNLGTKRNAEQRARIKASIAGKQLTGEAWAESHKDQYTLEVRAKMRAAKVGKKPANTKQVRCIETSQVFNGLTEASKALGVNRQSIYKQIKGELQAAGGLHFEYVEIKKA